MATSTTHPPNHLLEGEELGAHCAKAWQWWRDHLGSPKRVLAPMVDQSELPFRMLAREYGADICYSPMVHARLYAEGSEEKRARMFETAPEDRPLVVQFCGHDPQVLLTAARAVQHKCDAVDLNLGCPQGIARKGRYGAYLLEEQDLCVNIVRTLARGLDIPVTVKIRLLLDDREGTIAYAQKLAAAGASALTVHGRNREEKKLKIGDPDWEMIRRIKASLGIPVIANGGIALPEDVERCLTVTGVDAVMSSEMTLCRPDVFRPAGAPRAPVDAMVKRYGELAAKYEHLVHMAYKPCRAHIFKLLFPALQMHPDCRTRLVDATDCASMVAVAEELAARKWEEALLAKAPDGWLTASWYWRHRDDKVDIEAIFSKDGGGGGAAASSSSSSSSSSGGAGSGRTAEKQRELMPGVLEECERAAEALRAAEQAGANNKCRGQLKRKLQRAEKKKKKAMRKLANLEGREQDASAAAAAAADDDDDDDDDYNDDAEGGAAAASAGVVVFDCDGTLSESLPPHVEFCRRMNEKLDLGLTLPSSDDLDGCRSIAAAPMSAFLEKAGFPAASIARCVTEYEDNFARDHPVQPYAGIAAMLHRLRERGTRMAVVSSNTAVNVRAALGEDLCGLFVSIIGIDNGPPSKLDAIPVALGKMGVDPKATPVVYVGDTRKDAKCAVSTGCRFVGVNYGFEDLRDLPHPLASTVQELEQLLAQ